jgi:muramoyltetrapeptide carboxypeptidase LdcA involved in peptidoglycan recycling
MKMNDYHREILTSALDARVKEVTEYQVNIDNFSLAIERIGDDPDLQEFKQQLEGLLASSILEQRKAQIMLEVVQSQLE